MHLDHKAGDKKYVDFAGEKLSITDNDTGEVIVVEVFVAFLGASQLTYVEAVLSQQKKRLYRCLRECSALLWRRTFVDAASLVRPRTASGKAKAYRDDITLAMCLEEERDTNSALQIWNEH